MAFIFSECVKWPSIIQIWCYKVLFNIERLVWTGWARTLNQSNSNTSLILHGFCLKHIVAMPHLISQNVLRMFATSNEIFTESKEIQTKLYFLNYHVRKQKIKETNRSMCFKFNTYVVEHTKNAAIATLSLKMVIFMKKCLIVATYNN